LTSAACSVEPPARPIAQHSAPYSALYVDTGLSFARCYWRRCCIACPSVRPSVQPATDHIAPAIIDYSDRIRRLL